MAQHKSVVKRVFGDFGISAYQFAQLSKNALQPIGLSRFKYQFIIDSTNILKNWNTVGDFEYSYGLYAWLLLQDFENIHVTIFNTNKKKIWTCQEIANSFGWTSPQDYTISKKRFLNTNQPYDISLYLTCIPYLLKNVSPQEASALISKQTKRMAIIEMPNVNKDILAKEILKEKMDSVPLFLVSLYEHFNIVNCQPIVYSKDVVRMCYAFLKK